MVKDLWVRWDNREGELVYNWSGHDYDGDTVIRRGGTKRDANMLMLHLEQQKSVLGTFLVEELDKRGYDLTTLKFSVSKK